MQQSEANQKHSISQTATHVADLQLASRYSVSRATIWRWAQFGKFPKPIKLSPGCTRWKLSDVEAWEAEQRGVA